jgi:hypothetical protein
MRSVGIVFFGSKADNTSGMLFAHRARQRPAKTRFMRVLSGIVTLDEQGHRWCSLIGFRQKRAKRSYRPYHAQSMASLSCS